MQRGGFFMPEARPVRLAVLGLGWFSAYCTVLFLAVGSAGHSPAGFAWASGGTLLGGFAAGMAAAWALDAWYARGHNELGLIPFGSIGMTVLPLGTALWVAHDAEAMTHAFVSLSAALHGAFSAWFAVPLYRFLRDRPGAPDAGTRRVAALASMLILAAAGFATHTALERAGLGAWHVWVVLSLMNAAVALFIYRLLPEFLLRFLAWLLVHGIYRLRREGMEHIPERGAALVVCNHVSFADAVVVMAACTRPIRFVMDHRIFRAPVLSFIFRESRAIPIAPAKEDPEMLERAYDEVARALEQGELVGIFPEGAITRTGELQTFRNGVRRILDRTPVPVVPVALAGLWGSVFSRRYSGLWRYLPKAFSPRIRIRAGVAVPPEALDPQRLQEIVMELRGHEPWAR